MRRCERCESPNPETALYCAACGQALAPLPRQPWLRLDDLWQAAAFRRALQASGLLLAFRLSAGDLLSVGAQRVEARFLAFHLMHGLCLAGGLAWVRATRRPKDWLAWLGMGLLGGSLAESLEVWFTYRHWMGDLTLGALDWFGVSSSTALIYQILQGLRLLGVALPLWALAQKGERRFSRSAAAFFLLALAVGLRVLVRGAYLGWRGLFLLDGRTWQQVLLYGASALCLYYGLGQRALTPGAQKP